MSMISYEKARTLLDICEKLNSLGETDLEERTRARLVEILHPEAPKKQEPTIAKLPSSPKQEEEPIEELNIREIHGQRVAWNPSNNHCYELLANDDVGKWIGIYDIYSGKIDRTVPDPESDEPNWTTLPVLGETPDPYKKDFMRQTLIHGEEVAVTTSFAKLDGTSTVRPPLPKIYAVNKYGGALGFLYNNRLYANSNALFKAVYENKKVGNGWHSVCLRRPWGPKQELSWISLYKLEH